MIYKLINMKSKLKIKTFLAIVVISLITPSLISEVLASDISNKFMGLSKNSKFELVGTVECNFPTHHTQGILKIGRNYYLSSVEILEKTRKYDHPDEFGYDRTPGRGIGHLFKLDARGHLIKDLVLTEGEMYHPGGIDFDGTHIWISVAEYRPNSMSTIFRVDPNLRKAEKVFTVRDHIGDLVYDRDSNLLYGASWGSRRIYCWTPEGYEIFRYSNPSHFVDYQDGKYVGDNLMLASGMNKFNFGSGDQEDVREFGGMVLIELSTGRIVNAIPVLIYCGDGCIVTHNPMGVEVTDGKLQFYFAPENDETTIYIYQVNDT
jgi:hypothetical protein